MTLDNRQRHTPDQIIRKLAEGNKLLASGSGTRRSVPISRDRQVDAVTDPPNVVWATDFQFDATADG